MLVHSGDNLAHGTRHARSISLVPTIVVVVVFAIICGLLLIVIVVIAAVIPRVISTSGGRCWSIRSKSNWW
jgi:hypothetical protein